MKWSPNKYPAVMKQLDPRIREKAIEIANRLIEDGKSEEETLNEAIRQAQEWFLDLEG